MGFNQNTTYRDLCVLEKGGVAAISAIWESKSLEREQTKGGSLVDLKLGSTDFEKGLANSYRDHKKPPMDPFSSALGSSKRARAPSSGKQIVLCLVDGCKADLSKCRDYHRRHKVCEMHSKTPRVTIGGHEQRFCQQCSRFHSLGEFDEGKRSCRKRLEGHNRRRRKAQPEPLPMNPGNLFSASQGSRFLSFSSQPIISPTSVVSTNWSGAASSESNAALYNCSVSGSYSQAYRERPFPFLQVPESPLSGASSEGQTLHFGDRNFLSSSQGSRFLSFNSQPIPSGISMVSSNCSGASKSGSNAALYNSSVSGSYSPAYRGRPFPFLQVPESPLSGASSADQALYPDGSSSDNSQKLFCNGLNQVINSDRALSLLSSSSAETCEMGLGRIIHPNPTSPARPMLATLPYNSLASYPGSDAQGFEGESEGFMLLSNMRSSNSLCQGGSDGSSGSGGHQTISFSWE